MDKIRVLIVDDQKLFAGSLRIVLQGHGKEEIEVVGIAYNGREAIDLATEKLPDVVLMDVRMPVMDGVEATAELKRRFPAIRIMILTTFDDDDYVFQALNNGAAGYILKNIEPEELVTSVKAVHAGSLIVSSSVGVKLISHVELPQSQPPDAELAHEALVARLLVRYPELTKREAEVLQLLAQNWDNHEISERLFIAEQTVKNYTSRIYGKLGVPDRLHAIQLVRQATGIAEAADSG